MIRVAVVGANGYIGSSLCEAFRPKTSVKLIPVTRSSYEALSHDEYDVVINCATGSKRFWASQNPEQHFVETVNTTEHLVREWKFKKFIQISSVSARCELGSVYGKHKSLEEEVCRPLKDCLIVRLTATYGPGLSKGVLIDILNGKAYVSGKSQYAFSPLNFVSGWIVGHLDRTGLVEVGARNSISLQEIAHRSGLKVEFGDRVEDQGIMDPEGSFPDAADVISYMDGMKKIRGL